ncbi:PTS sugar transporter subunit IIB [Aerococcus urinae]|uniref:PTS sugar transporter subunit IIB n=2 Tax=Aerococcaceae TaxID=186827 RepID=UPI000DCBFA51|nr:PTS sugar transporter subunit IIB [Aerococcus urinae]RAV93827.1 PTS mannose/fructose/sorbose transporter subunit IIB [Aerococcus mictus]MDK6375282.1 PTS sugar transporter subunit IIB [Aerococcus urinae]MDK6420130.1 PTS sugar transporter subunit IIB [Aerococcus urinae]MDK8075623.1 PTS sugar transporter subunit IIB [Aerococcus urinae]MDK8084608.1 PTS sugar transporter subunit IIB [Aerococcus urinae]
MGEIVLVRIDDRLIHGQVMTAWVKETGANQIIIVDDEVSKDLFMSEVMKASAPVGVTINVESVESSLPIINDIQNNNNKVIILSKGPKTILSLLKNGIKFKKVIIGGMGINSERTTLYKNIAATDEERNAIKEIMNMGTEVTIHIIPSQKEVNVEKFV